MNVNFHKARRCEKDKKRRKR